MWWCWYSHWEAVVTCKHILGPTPSVSWRNRDVSRHWNACWGAGAELWIWSEPSGWLLSIVVSDLRTWKVLFMREHFGISAVSGGCGEVRVAWGTSLTSVCRRLCRSGPSLRADKATLQGASCHFCRSPILLLNIVFEWAVFNFQAFPFYFLYVWRPCVPELFASLIVWVFLLKALQF